MFVLLVQFVVKAGTEARVMEFMRKMEENTRREPGCQLYNPRKFCFYEQYEDEAALETHRAAPYFAEYVTQGFGPLIDTITRETFTTISS